ncbi:hypothetical protein EMIHUDRAFT_223193 [Emiliania huxleyi CCMP1516]|uniref:tRNA-uridine aminocarboxypropyltransferase 1 n=2 Tax=Emiliania huxleyi TaxID=2903 RepID=A0A0D3KW43_EMIH1|nr:hypothetical protein EMIHUDRAFT_223193 [Emiliania huxleyi CCMP1516]EOD39978.1 hypothetical protein EMIHUDRAFT_223193 [Emiliania huxleyi CCMP1516]|eukprot:XP_005792407.1 hypothetical protein EMIHUDRAFT_223193 [Emiliania huxleyi CCMP1516]
MAELLAPEPSAEAAGGQLFRVGDISSAAAIAKARRSDFREVFDERDREGDARLAKLKLAPLGQESPGRERCSGCGVMRSAFCSECLAMLPGQARPEIAKLPFRFVIITHPKEPRSRSTGVHAAVLAAGCVTLRTFDKGDEACLPPELFPAGRTFLLFPSDDALTVPQLAAKREPAGTKAPAKARVQEGDGADEDGNAGRLVVVVIDSTWSQARQIMGHPCLQALPRVAVASHRTAFWRRQHLGENYLATVEAVYYVCTESHGDAYDGRYDNLLFFFVKFRSLVRQRIGTIPCPTEAKGKVCTKLQCQHSHSLSLGADDHGRKQPVLLESSEGPTETLPVSGAE